MNLKWKRVGWRSLKYLTFPKCIVRFGVNGGRLKLLEPPEVSMKISAIMLASLLGEAHEVWKDQPKGKHYAKNNPKPDSS